MLQALGKQFNTQRDTMVFKYITADSRDSFPFFIMSGEIIFCDISGAKKWILLGLVYNNYFTSVWLNQNRVDGAMHNIDNIELYRKRFISTYSNIVKYIVQYTVTKRPRIERDSFCNVG